MIYIKSDKEIELMRKPCQIVRDVLCLCEEKIKAGMTTKELDKIAYDYITSCGAKPSFLGYGGFPAATCISIDEQVVHGFPSDRIIEEDQIVSVDVGAFSTAMRRGVYTSDISVRKRKNSSTLRENVSLRESKVYVSEARSEISERRFRNTPKRTVFPS